MFVHYCHCGAWGAFGYGVCLLKDKKGEWFCAEHRPGAKPKEESKYEFFNREGYTLMERKRP